MDASEAQEFYNAVEDSVISLEDALKVFESKASIIQKRAVYRSLKTICENVREFDVCDSGLLALRKQLLNKYNVAIRKYESYDKSAASHGELRERIKNIKI